MGTVEDRIKKQKEEAERRKKEQVDASGGTPISPMGVSGQGATEDQAKMAGTPASKVTTGAMLGDAPAPLQEAPDALEQAAVQQQEAQALPQDESLQTKLGEQTFDDEQRDAAQERAKAFSEKMSTFGSLGTRVENMVTGAFSGVTAEGDLKNLAKDVGFEIGDVEGLMADGTNEADMTQLLSDFSDIGRSDADAAFKLLVDNQSKFKNPSSGIMSFVDAAYKKDPDAMHRTVAKLVADDIIDPDQVNFESLINSGFVNVGEDGVIAELGVSTDELQEILGDEWMSLTPDEIGEEVEAKRGEVLDNKAKIEEQLSDPDLPAQTRVALLDEMKRMGAIGAVEYEQRAVEAQQEAASSGQILIGGEVQDVAELLKDENIKTDVMNFLSDPESEENKEWARLNPEFADWLGRELESLNITKDTLESNIGNFEGIQKHNEDFVDSNLSSRGGRVSTDIMNILGYGDQGFELENYGAGDDPIYNMLSGLGTGPQTQQAVAIMNGIPKSQLTQLKGLPPEKLKNLLTNPNKMQEFATIAKMKDEWSNVKNSNNVDSMADMILGGGRGGRSLTNSGGVKSRMAQLMVQSKLGGNPEVARQYELMKTLFDADGNGHIDDAGSVKTKIDELLGKEGDLEDMVNNQLSGRISDFRNMGDTGYGSNMWNHIKDRVGSGDTTIDDNDLNVLAGRLDINTMEQLKDPKLTGLGINPHRVDRLMHEQADKKSQAILDNMGDWDPKGGEGNNINIQTYKSTFDKLHKIASSGHPYEKEAANHRLSKIIRKTTEPKDMDWNDKMHHISRLNGLFAQQGVDKNQLPDNLRESGGLAAGSVAGIMANMYATWRNYASNPNDMQEFVNSIHGRIGR